MYPTIEIKIESNQDVLHAQADNFTYTHLRNEGGERESGGNKKLKIKETLRRRKGKGDKKKSSGEVCVRWFLTGEC